MTGQIQPPRSDPQNPFNSLNKEVTLLKAEPLAIKVMIIFILNQELIARGLKPRVDLQTRRLWQCYRATNDPLEQGRGVRKVESLNGLKLHTIFHFLVVPSLK